MKLWQWIKPIYEFIILMIFICIILIESALFPNFAIRSRYNNGVWFRYKCSCKYEILIEKRETIQYMKKCPNCNKNIDPNDYKKLTNE